MRVRIRHSTTYLYDDPPNAIIQILRLTPRNHEGQQVVRWRIDVDRDARLVAGEDAFGNIVHTLSINRMLDDLTIAVEGEVVTTDTKGIIRGAAERFPTALYLRETGLTKADAALQALTREVFAGEEPLAALHALLAHLHKTMKFDTGKSDTTRTAAEAFAAKNGVCQDFAHIFVAVARAAGLPARYVGGYLMRTDTVTQSAGHAWAEVLVPQLGWVGFDPANGISPTEAYVRVAFGLDYLGAAPVRGSRSGGTAEQMKVSVLVDAAQTQSQA